MESVIKNDNLSINILIDKVVEEKYKTMKTMEYPNWSNDSGDVLVGFVIGMICAIIKLLDIHLLADAYMIVLFKVFLTAIIGGAGGVVGKHLITYGMRKWKEKFNKKK